MPTKPSEDTLHIVSEEDATLFGTYAHGLNFILTLILSHVTVLTNSRNNGPGPLLFKFETWNFKYEKELEVTVSSAFYPNRCRLGFLRTCIDIATYRNIHRDTMSMSMQPFSVPLFWGVIQRSDRCVAIRNSIWIQYRIATRDWLLGTMFRDASRDKSWSIWPSVSSKCNSDWVEVYHSGDRRIRSSKPSFYLRFWRPPNVIYNDNVSVRDSTQMPSGTPYCKWDWGLIHTRGITSLCRSNWLETESSVDQN